MAASLIYEMKRKIHKESVPEDVVVPQPEVVRCYHPEEVCKEISFKTDDGIEIVINHDDPAEELRQAKQLAKELKGKHATPASEDSPLISEIIEKYCLEKILERSWTPKTEDENRAIFNVFLEIVGDIPVKTFGHQEARDYKDTLAKLPPNRSKSPLYRNKSVAQILSMRSKDVMSASTVNKNINRVSGLLSWALNNGYTDRNCLKGKSLKVKKRPDEYRDVFTLDELDLIFAPKQRYLRPHYYWLPLLGLYTGARIEELCQLHLNDIHKVDGIWCFDFNDNTPDKKLKSPASKRLVPLHTRLIELGFLDYKKRVKGNRLFPELKRRRDGYSQDASKWFGRFKRKLGIQGRHKAFHSFRHTFANHLKQKRVEPHLVAALTGHADNSMVFGVYGKAYEPKVLLEVIKKLDFNI